MASDCKVSGRQVSVRTQVSSFFCNLLLNVCLVNLKEDNGRNWARNSMFLCGLDVPKDGKWTTSQLSKLLQAIVAQYPDELSARYEASMPK